MVTIIDGKKNRTTPRGKSISKSKISLLSKQAYAHNHHLAFLGNNLNNDTSPTLWANTPRLRWPSQIILGLGHAEENLSFNLSGLI